MARKLSDLQSLRDNENASKTGANYGSKRPISVDDLRSYMNSNFFRGTSTSKTDLTPTTGNAGVPSTNISVNSSFSNRSWISIFARGTSEKDHEYFSGTNGRLRVKCEAAIPGKWKLIINKGEYTASSNGAFMDTENTLDVLATTSTSSTSTNSGYTTYSTEIHYSFDGGSTYSKLIGFTATIGFGTTDCSWSNGTDTAINIGGKGGTEGTGDWDHLTYN
jgi:hypothetical protein